ncbi:MAG: Ni/Fe-hydrogenase cytochrome b subunit [Chloroflexota bacterium]|nr:Ni/Fe-hydrogenase cytochrome b subunit [Chloroflexota bacterium]
MGDEKIRLSTWGTYLTVLLVLIAGGVAMVRLLKGLGAVTNLSDAWPWGLWIGFDVVAGVALAGGGFTLAAMVYIFNLKRYHSVVRPAILTAFLGYIMVAAGIFFDIGRPWTIWHPAVYWNFHSVMFEVAWCVMLYTSVLALEFSPSLWERLRWKRALDLFRYILIPLVIMGIILSTLHQSSLGSLFLITPNKLHPLWYTSLLPYLFFISAIALGMSMVIFESIASARAFKREIERPAVAGLGLGAAWVLTLYAAVRFTDLIVSGRLAEFTFGWQGWSFLVEVVPGLLLPIVLLFQKRVRESPGWLFTAACLVVAGMILNRLNVSIIGHSHTAQGTYFPSWMEFALTAGLVAFGFLAFKLAVKYLPVLPPREDVAVAVSRRG